MFLTTVDRDVCGVLGSLICVAQVALVVMGMRKNAITTLLVVAVQAGLFSEMCNMVGNERRVATAETLAGRLVTDGAQRSCTALYGTNVMELDMVRWHVNVRQQRQDERPPAFELTYDWKRSEICVADLRSGTARPRPIGPAGENGVNGAPCQ
jgi:hypothetical protein